MSVAGVLVWAWMAAAAGDKATPTAIVFPLGSEGLEVGDSAQLALPFLGKTFKLGCQTELGTRSIPLIEADASPGCVTATTACAAGDLACWGRGCGTRGPVLVLRAKIRKSGDRFDLTLTASWARTDGAIEAKVERQGDWAKAGSEIAPAVALLLSDIDAKVAQSAAVSDDAVPSRPAPAATEVAKREAKGLYADARNAFAAQHWDQAAKLFAKAYALTGRVEYLYNLGLTNEARKNLALAAESFRRFLAEAPVDNPKRADAEARLGRLPKPAPPPLAAAPPPPPPPPPPTVAEKSPPPADDAHAQVWVAPPSSTERHEPASEPASGGMSLQRMGAWASAGVGVIGLGFGIGFAVDAGNVRGQASSLVSGGAAPPGQVGTLVNLRSHYDTSSTISVVSFVGAGVFAAASAALFVLAPSERATVEIGPARASVSVRF